MAVIVMTGTAIAAAVMIPGGFAGARSMHGIPPRNYLYSNLALSLVAALFGGWLTARLAPASPMLHAAVLAIFLLAMSFVSARSHAARQPAWYPWAITVIGVAGVLLGGVWEVSASAVS